MVIKSNKTNIDDTIFSRRNYILEIPTVNVCQGYVSPLKLPHRVTVPTLLPPSLLVTLHWYTPGVVTGDRLSELLVTPALVLTLAVVGMAFINHSTCEVEEVPVKEQERVRGVPNETSTGPLTPVSFAITVTTVEIGGEG